MSQLSSAHAQPSTCSGNFTFEGPLWRLVLVLLLNIFSSSSFPGMGGFGEVSAIEEFSDIPSTKHVEMTDLANE